jgi:hypothetical protein
VVAAGKKKLAAKKYEPTVVGGSIVQIFSLLGTSNADSSPRT